LSTAAQLSPPYDYFSFAEIFVGSKEHTNVWYKNLLKKALANAKGEIKHDIAQTINEFNKENTKKTPFSNKYEQYWSSQDDES
ncbi:hypothetical protein BDF14DRAFT_1992112, partial [Spinellus fusiger]